MTLSPVAWFEARAEAYRQGALLGSQPVELDLAASLDRTLATDLFALGDVPGHDGAAMDGWAVSGDGPWTVGAPIVAGDTAPGEPLANGQGRPITTGAPVPPGTTTVIRSEDGDVNEAGTLIRHAGATSRRHIRAAGEEIARGQLLFPRGVVLTPPRAALAAASGIDRVLAVRPPTVRVEVLGDEIIGTGVPRLGMVRDVFTHTLPNILRSFGADPVAAVRVADDSAATASALRDAGERLVVTTGGTSRSTTDHIRDALDHLGAELLIDRVAVRPGRPMLLARRGETLFLCLPGNPMAAMVGLVLLGGPLIGGLLGRPLEQPSSVTIGVDVPNEGPGDVVVAYRLTPAGAVPASHQTSAMLRGLADSDGLMIVGDHGRVAGDCVPSLRLPWL